MEEFSIITIYIAGQSLEGVNLDGEIWVGIDGRQFKANMASFIEAVKD